MMNLYSIPTHHDSPSIINAIVEIPKGTTAKYEYDDNLGVFRLSRCLASAMVYPASYGFIPSTLADDGDALDVVVYNATPIDRGTLVECEVVGALDMTDDGDKDYKILAVPTSHVRNYNSLEDIDPMFLNVASNFFQHYKDLEAKDVCIYGWLDKTQAVDIVRESIKTLFDEDLDLEIADPQMGVF